MDIWEILGIPPTTDIIVIKKTYADRAKEWHPEEHPEEFKRLRNAYQTALKWAKSGGAEKAEASVEPSPVKQPEPRLTEKAEASAEPTSAKQPEPAPQAAEREEEPHPRFSYDDVSSIYQEELAEQFFGEFNLIAWNPYLQNRKEVWNYFLLRPDYDDLYYHEEFWRRFLEEIYVVSGWVTETLDYFAWWQSLYRDAERKWQGDDILMNTDNKKWSRKRRRSEYTDEGFIPASREQILEHLAILKTMEERRMDATLMNAASVEGYLKYYEAFMKDNEKWLEHHRRFSRRKRFKKWMFRVLLLYLAIILVLVLLVRIVMSVVKAEEVREQKKQEKVIQREEREQQKEWQQELDERFEKMQEQYRDWMEQEP